MSLSKRDTFVRWLDPLRTVWEDAEGGHHFSLPAALKAFELDDTEENRREMTEIFRQVIKQSNSNAVIEERTEPDSKEYWKHVSPQTQAECDHKFLGTKHCVKCGWEPDFQGGPMGGA